MGLLMHPVVPLDNRARATSGVVLAALPVGRAFAALRTVRPASVQQMERCTPVRRSAPRPVCLHLTWAGDHFSARLCRTIHAGRGLYRLASVPAAVQPVEAMAGSLAGALFLKHKTQNSAREGLE